MKVGKTHYRTIWLKKDDPKIVQIIDQRKLPFEFCIEDLTTVDDVAHAIKDMHVRGAGLIGATAGFGMYLSALHASQGLKGLKSLKGSQEEFLKILLRDGKKLEATRPTAINLRWAVKRQLDAIEQESSIPDKVEKARQVALEIADEDADFCRRIGEHGKTLIQDISSKKGGQPVNVLTHCNAGWLAFVDYGTATAPIYAAHDSQIPVHVWVDETRPWNQGARLTAWELGEHGVPHTVIADNTGGHLMQHGMVDLVITGTDRTTYTGDVANKIGTYLKALAAKDNNVPFYVALPSSTFDWTIEEGLREIPIEKRDESEVKTAQGLYNGKIISVQLTPKATKAANYSFDVTPARLISGLITERGICKASKESISRIYPEKTEAFKNTSYQ